jgi:rubredoxin
MNEDQENGWGPPPPAPRAPAAVHWHCPVCTWRSLVADWAAGDGDTRACPHCGHVFDPTQSGRISEADEPGHVVRDDDKNLCALDSCKGGAR